MKNTIGLVLCLAAALALPAGLVAAGCVTSGCATSASCSPGERFSQGMCLPAGSGSRPSSPTAETDAGALGDGCDAVAPKSGKTGTFGATCKTDDDCGNPAPICAIQPTDATGFCSQINCSTNPSVCPAGWSCFDPSVINPDWPTVCVKN